MKCVFIEVTNRLFKNCLIKQCAQYVKKAKYYIKIEDLLNLAFQYIVCNILYSFSFFIEEEAENDQLYIIISLVWNAKIALNSFSSFSMRLSAFVSHRHSA